MRSKDLISLVLEGQSPHDVIAGAVFDFAGYLTTRDETIKVGAKANAAPMADHVKQWAMQRQLDIDNADVEHWESALLRVMAGESPSAVVDEMTKQAMIATYPKPMGMVKNKRKQDNEDITEAQSAKKIKAALPVKPAKLKQWSFEFALQQIARQTEGSDRELSKEHAIAQASYGIAYAYETGRLPGEIHLKLRRMNGLETIQLVGEVADENLTQARVPEYLIKKYSSLL
jgi:hypothetical protein